MSKILFGSNEATHNSTVEGTDLKKTATSLNLFRGTTEQTEGKASFPNWDILPPYQFINSRTKK
jgi:hypothetical protein